MSEENDTEFALGDSLYQDDTQGPEPVKPKKEKQEKPKKKGKNLVDFGVGISVDPDAPLAQYTKGPVKAFRAYGKVKGQGEIPMFAFICDRSPLPRFGDVPVFKSFMSYNLSTLVNSGVRYWPPAKEERYIFIYRDNWGEPLIGRDAPQAGEMKPETLVEKVLTPLIPALRDLRDKDLYHGALTPWNLWTADKESMSHLIVGDFLTAPPAYDLPVLYETIERSMAEPIGRGIGTHWDDMYTLGVTLTTLLRAHDVSGDLTDDEIIRKKIQIGSYGMVTNKDRFTGSTLELLRGLLHDDERERWSVDDVAEWLEGRRLTPRSALKRKKASRPLMFADKRYVYPQPLAMDLASDSLETKRIINEGELDNWLRRSLEKKFMAEDVETCIQFSEQFGGNNNYDSLVLTTVSMALDPKAPIRFKGRQLRAMGVGDALVEAVVEQRDLQLFGEMISMGLVGYFTREFDSRNVDATTILTRFDACEKFVKNSRTNFGFERAIYTLSPSAPCLSPRLSSYYVLTPAEILPAYEDICEKKKAPKEFIDRHIIGFLFAKDSKMIDVLLKDFGVEQEWKKQIFELRVLAKLQEKHKTGYAPNLAQVISKRLDVVYERLHDKALQDTLKEKVAKFVKVGDLVEMAELLDDFALREKDRATFFQRIKDYQKITEDRKKLAEKLEEKDKFGRKTGRDIAATVSCVVAVIIVLISTILKFTS